MIKMPDNRGVSLAIGIGLLFLLVTMTATVSELVIRALRSARQIEASDKAYFAAEAGIENALYELSAHTAGYETDDLGTGRNEDFSQNGVGWRNEWEIKNKGLNSCVAGDWESPFSPIYCGRIYQGEKLIVNLFSDDNDPIVSDPNELNTELAEISKLDVLALEFKLRFPKPVVVANAGAFSGLPLVNIDNDGDFNPGDGSGLNEDGPESVDGKDVCPYSGGIAINDNDCDGREDEDSLDDPVILWRMIDNMGNSFQPLRGCVGDTQHSSHPIAGDDNATLCEKNFVKSGDEVSIEFDQDVRGNSVVAGIQTISSLLDFISTIPDTNQLQMEVLVVAPNRVIDSTLAKEIPIPYFEYGIDYDAGTLELPSTYFSIKSDGYYREFKQSITTNVTPRATSRLLDLTIIQQ